ncbi:hypothetical protein LTR13_006793 [Exophiala sideris]|uniref:PIN domain-containing protein n=1 Tax=Exophiala sideris TaxID=1016849 RepID=A0ABR0J3A8_9EURO|nr:hypothetical protein LTR13_006793 [Exophiala sideris]KAK5055563.1 hypothetical protein LTR69_008396 [Exophiala sideris]
MAAKVYFDTNPLLEFEVFHDLRFPRLRLATGEVISVSIAARLLHLLKKQHSYSCILCHLKEEFNVEFCAEALEAVLERDFDITDETLPVGETVIPVPLEINHRGFVKGHVLPSGIYYEIINLRDSGANFIKQYVVTRWGLRVPENVIVFAINEWVHRMAIANPFIPPPADARPAHDGRILGELATTADTISSNRSAFANNPPPVYSPSPVYQNARGQRVVLRHPRQVDAIYPEGEAQAPPYSVGNTTPPSYGGVSSFQSAGSGPLLAATTHLRPADDANMSEASSANNAVTQVPSKPRHSTEDTLIKYSRQNVIDYLFDRMHSANAYPVDPFEPVRVPMVSFEFRQLMSLFILQRSGELTPAKLFPIYRVGAGPEINQTGQSISRLIVKVIKEFRLSSCASSRTIATRLRTISNREGLVFLIDHMRAARGEQSLGILPTYNDIWQAIIEELRLSDNMYVLKVMGKYAPISPPIIHLRYVLSEVDKARDANTAMTIVVSNSAATPCPRLAISFPNVFVQPTYSIGELERDKTRTFVGEPLDRYMLLLFDAKSLLQAIIESTTSDGFEAGKRHLEKYLRYAIKRSATKAPNAMQTMTELEAVVYRVRALQSSSDVLVLSPEYWAAVLTDAALAMSRQYADSRGWLPIPDAEVHESTGIVVAVPVQQPPTDFSVQYHSHTLKHLEGWVRLARRIYAPTALEGMIEHFYGNYELLMTQWAADRASPYPILGTLLPERLAKQYERGLSLLWHLQDRFQVSANVVDPGRRAALEKELQHFKQVEQAFKARLETNKTSDFANLLDFTAAEVAMMHFSRELIRLDPWYRQAGQLPLEPPAIVPLAASVERALDGLDANCMDLQQAELAAEQAEVVTEQHFNVENTVAEEDTFVDQRNDLEHLESENSLFEDNENEADGIDNDDHQQQRPVLGNVVFSGAPSENVHEDSSATQPNPTDRSSPLAAASAEPRPGLPWDPSGPSSLRWHVYERVRRAREQQAADAEAGPSRSAGTVEHREQTGSSSADHENSPDIHATTAASEAAFRSARPVTLVEQELDLGNSSVLRVSAPTAPTAVQTEEAVVLSTVSHTSGIDLLQRLRGHVQPAIEPSLSHEPRCCGLFRVLCVRRRRNRQEREPLMPR